ncbi:uncharacterized protein EI90DRAFT_3013127 [Cantharellus anzutake]|uniref:uncharacterized protein n=1 Tax=Cantharellus anzutake TaxID=1750568 RepID=UPI0019050D1F|nr:uncharacterized protein EI90DRAFT_3013127 [Cantharellus anzutake]KAF8339057.1 hypothetical protein EI90DRAFT_3013127 [Cantharellus anzutake]
MPGPQRCIIMVLLAFAISMCRDSWEIGTSVAGTCLCPFFLDIEGSDSGEVVRGGITGLCLSMGVAAKETNGFRSKEQNGIGLPQQVWVYRPSYAGSRPVRETCTQLHIHHRHWSYKGLWVLDIQQQAVVRAHIGSKSQPNCTVSDIALAPIEGVYERRQRDLRVGVSTDKPQILTQNIQNSLEKPLLYVDSVLRGLG